MTHTNALLYLLNLFSLILVAYPCNKIQERQEKSLPIRLALLILTGLFLNVLLMIFSISINIVT